MFRGFLILFIITIASHLSFSQKLGIEDLISLNSKTTTQLSGIFQKFRWTEHRGLTYFKENRTEYFYSKRHGEDPLSFEIIKYSSLYVLHDSYIEFITLDRERYENLKKEMVQKYKVKFETLTINDETLDVYSNDQYVFIYKSKATENPPVTRFHVFIYNTETYKLLQRKQEYNDFWQE